MNQMIRRLTQINADFEKATAVLSLNKSALIRVNLRIKIPRFPRREIPPSLHATAAGS